MSSASSSSDWHSSQEEDISTDISEDEEDPAAAVLTAFSDLHDAIAGHWKLVAHKRRQQRRDLRQQTEESEQQGQAGQEKPEQSGVRYFSELYARVEPPQASAGEEKSVGAQDDFSDDSFRTPGALTLDLGDTPLGLDEDSIPTFLLLSECSPFVRVEALVLDDCGLEPKDSGNIAEAVGSLRLRELSLQSNGLGDVGISSLAPVLADHLTLLHVELCDNRRWLCPRSVVCFRGGRDFNEVLLRHDSRVLIG
jgi:hypothetical protein